MANHCIVNAMKLLNAHYDTVEHTSFMSACAYKALWVKLAEHKARRVCT